MPEFYQNEERPERALLVALDTGDYDVASSAAELYELVRSAGAEPFGTVTQKRPAPDPATCVGSGMVEQIAAACEANEIDLLVFDRELSPSQVRNLEAACKTRVIDRTMLILDIFALRARSREGRLQVELAQLRYLLPRLSGQGTALSRLGGGIGTRGPGETQLETDRRHIRRRIESLRAQLAQVEARRAETARRRKKDGVLMVALVGYTNAGKSTLMNTLTDAGVLAKDQLFATLDPTARALKLPGGRSVMLVDTVGFIRRLPHHLVEAFKSTLEQAATADVVLCVCDASSPEAQEHLQVSRDLLQEIAGEARPIIPVMNKCDLVPALHDLPMVGGAVRISAKTGEGIDRLLEAIEENLPLKLTQVELLFPFHAVGKAAGLRNKGLLREESYTAEGLHAFASLDPAQLAAAAPYIVRRL